MEPRSIHGEVARFSDRCADIPKPFVLQKGRKFFNKSLDFNSLIAGVREGQSGGPDSLSHFIFSQQQPYRDV